MGMDDYKPKSADVWRERVVTWQSSGKRYAIRIFALRIGCGMLSG